MNLIETYLNKIQSESGFSFGGMVDVHNWGGPGGITIGRLGDHININIGPDGLHAIKYNSLVIGGGVLAYALILISLKIYQDFISKTGKKCRYYKGPVRDICIKKARIEGYKIRIKELMKNKAACKLTKNPKKCLTKIELTINKLQRKIDHTKSSLDNMGVKNNG